MTIEVINGRIDGFIGKHTIYIGRANKSLPESPLHNPFSISKTLTRQQSIEKCKVYLAKELVKKGSVYQELLKIANRVTEGELIKLACWCKPEDCHGDFIKFLVEQIIIQKSKV